MSCRPSFPFCFGFLADFSILLCWFCTSQIWWLWRLNLWYVSVKIGRFKWFVMVIKVLHYGFLAHLYLVTWKKYSEQHFVIFLLHPAFLIKWSIEFIRLFSESTNKPCMLALLNRTLFKLQIYEQIRRLY